MRGLDDGLQRGGGCRRVVGHCNERWRVEPSRSVRGDEVALAAKDLGEATASCHICSAGELACEKQSKGDDKPAKGDVTKSGVHFSDCAGSGTNAILDGGLVMFG